MMDKKFSFLSDKKEQKFKEETVGLVTLEDFRKKRRNIENDEKNKDTDREKKKRSKLVANKLSFDVEDEEELDEQEDAQTKITKNPDVETSFLPDRDREEKELREREELERQWKEHQDQLKSQPLEITYFHWTGDEAKIDPSKYFTVTVRKGTTISSFFEIIKQEIKDLRSISTNDLMFVKEDFVVPQHHTFYDLVLSISKEGKQLFHFDKLDDPRQKELYSIRIVDRKWYERNRHIFPYSKWTVFDPSLQTSTRDTIDPK